MKDFALSLMERRNNNELQQYGRVLTDEERDEVRRQEEIDHSTTVARMIDLPIPRRFTDATFETFECYNDRMKDIVEHLKSGKSAVLYGKYGTGKTHLAFASCRYHREQGKRVKYILAFDLFDSIKQAFGSGSAKSIVQEYSSFDYLVIDELDKAYGTETDFLYFYQIINARYNEMRNTVIITNADKASLPKVAGASSLDRIASDGGMLIEMTGENYRHKERD